MYDDKNINFGLNTVLMEFDYTLFVKYLINCLFVKYYKLNKSCFNLKIRCVRIVSSTIPCTLVTSKQIITL